MADRIKISAEARDDFGKGYARRLRKAGKIPAVIYGHGAEPVHIALPGHETMLAARNPNAVLSVDVDGTNHLTLIKDVQRHAIRPEIYHVDLLTVRRGERVEVEVPVVVEGEVAPGNISTQSESVLLLDVDALDVPEELLVDVTDRQDGEHVTAADVLLPEDVTLVSDPELIVVNVSAEVEQDLGEEPETEEEGEESEDSEASEGSEEE
ncbi:MULTISPECIES: 50S ribosomal protein L25/general stress protein Ctc [Rothia]|uniref:Large ribosomal subunit protein bL25 n=1 Tax=Rothia kristinae TaxID=37923 RepID=A0A0Q2U8L6_9MICC|nr:50S ribosomal protein L25/general stress protein Ctc [Rothia kristinae]MBE8526643.1 50S ribosomal protein L25/general stress protein Ctc [Amycolatopsis sp. H6(2020)]TDP56142.1 large subunit ribosomal protein L25 [Kocuria sp. AG109]SIM05895.1 50S ribosomal protein L25 [Mycobacteroides abscessus subsp. abscessus]KTR39293.1 50S ribosomal protein L25 [Rothia kristinae]KTR59450.1 50S ribosomal protein L25 [Rothia kristinae]